jgi:protein-S-isoprenylcysteine O-methyltransferase Ste14
MIQDSFSRIVCKKNLLSRMVGGALANGGRVVLSDCLNERMEDWRTEMQSFPLTRRTSPLDNRIPPPIVTLIVGAAMWGSSLLSPVLHLTPAIRFGGSAITALIGFSILATGFITFVRSRTTIDPVQIDRASSLVTGGIFRITRNPMYVGFATILLGWAMFLSAPLAALGPVAFVLFTTRFQIIPEERAMRSKFGWEYEAYRSRVRRWI